MCVGEESEQSPQLACIHAWAFSAAGLLCLPTHGGRFRKVLAMEKPHISQRARSSSGSSDDGGLSTIRGHAFVLRRRPTPVWRFLA